MEILTLGEVAEYINGRAFKPDEWEESGLPIIRIQNLTNSTQVVNRTTKTFEEKYLVKDGDLLFAWSASLGAHIWHGEDGWLNQHIFKVVPNGKVDKMYLYYYLLHVIEDLYSKTHGSGMVHITLKPFKSTPIPVPRIEEQKKVVELLNSLFARLDEAKEKVQTVIDGYEIRRAAILHQAFSGELTAKWRNQLEILMEKWKYCKLGDVLKEIKYGTSEKSDYDYYGIPVLRIPNIGDMEIVFDDIKKLKSSSCMLNEYMQADDILMIRSNGSKDLVGKCAIMPQTSEKYTYASFLIRLRVTNEVLPSYIIWYLNSNEARNQLFVKAKSSSGIHNINSKEISDINIPIPELNEQQQIICVIESLIEKEKEIKSKAEMFCNYLDNMKKSILQKAFRGGLGTNNPNQESAIALLKTII